MKDKNNAYADYMEMIRNSWTYGKLTPAEAARLEAALENMNRYNRVVGSYNARWEQLQAMYELFLAGVGYSGPAWRTRWDTRKEA